MDETAPSALLALLDLEEIERDLFRGFSPIPSGRQVYGGQAVAQALVAATRTVPADRPVHSLHGYFVLAGDPATPIDFAVERVRDGKSFTTRRCNATQRGQTIFTMEASFQRREQGFAHADEMHELLVLDLQIGDGSFRRFVLNKKPQRNGLTSDRIT